MPELTIKTPRGRTVTTTNPWITWPLNVLFWTLMSPTVVLVFVVVALWAVIADLWNRLLPPQEEDRA